MPHYRSEEGTMGGGSAEPTTTPGAAERGGSQPDGGARVGRSTSMRSQARPRAPLRRHRTTTVTSEQEQPAEVRSYVQDVLDKVGRKGTHRFSNYYGDDSRNSGLHGSSRVSSSPDTDTERTERRADPRYSSQQTLNTEPSPSPAASPRGSTAGLRPPESSQGFRGSTGSLHESKAGRYVPRMRTKLSRQPSDPSRVNKHKQERQEQHRKPQTDGAGSVRSETTPVTSAPAGNTTPRGPRRHTTGVTLNDIRRSSTTSQSDRSQQQSTPSDTKFEAKSYRDLFFAPEHPPRSNDTDKSHSEHRCSDSVTSRSADGSVPNGSLTDDDVTYEEWTEEHSVPIELVPENIIQQQRASKQIDEENLASPQTVSDETRLHVEPPSADRAGTPPHVSAQKQHTLHVTNSSKLNSAKNLKNASNTAGTHVPHTAESKLSEEHSEHRPHDTSKTKSIPSSKQHIYEKAKSYAETSNDAKEPSDNSIWEAIKTKNGISQHKSAADESQKPSGCNGVDKEHVNRLRQKGKENCRDSLHNGSETIPLYNSVQPQTNKKRFNRSLVNELLDDSNFDSDEDDLFNDIESVQTEEGADGTNGVVNDGKILDGDRDQSAWGRLSEVWTQWDRGVGPGQLKYPSGLAILPEDRLVVADVGNVQLQVFSQTGEFECVAERRAKDVGRPQCVAVSPDGSLLAVTYGMSRQVKLFDTQLQKKCSWGRDMFNNCSGIAFVRDGNLVISDVWHQYLSLLTPDGTEVRTIGKDQSRLRAPFYVTVDHHNLIYASDYAQSNVKVFDQQGTLLRTIGAKGGFDYQLHHPKGICVTEQDRLLVCDYDHDRISVFDTSSGAFIEYLRALEPEMDPVSSPVAIVTKPNCRQIFVSEVRVADDISRVKALQIVNP